MDPIVLVFLAIFVVAWLWDRHRQKQRRTFHPKGD